MGQILKNFPAALVAETKVEVMQESCDLGLRLLSVALEKVETGRKELVEKVVASIRRLHPSLPDQKIRAQTERYLWILTLLTSYGLLKVTARAITSPELEPIYSRVFPEKSTKAKMLINLALRLETSSSFPKGLITRVSERVKNRPLPDLLLKFLVLDHFARIHVPPPDRQSICDKLGIKYLPLAANRKYLK